MSKLTFIVLLCFFGYSINGQFSISLDGQLSSLINVSPQNDLPLLLGSRYIGEFDVSYKLDTVRSIDAEFSYNLDGVVFTNLDDITEADLNYSPYRTWIRYSAKRFEIRLGLQKIEFGSARALRPLQWFNQIDPRDPLQLTTGVNGILGRYYFQNNANIWLWGLYNNRDRRGFDVFASPEKTSEYGMRFQYPVPKGEIAITGHRRKVDSRFVTNNPDFKETDENRIGIDGKWDIGIGLWFEAVHLWNEEDLSFLSNQTSITFGTDYTFPLGNGLNITTEHMLISTDENAFHFESTSNITAMILAYPLGIFDSISSVVYYGWEQKAFSFFVNYEHQFDKFSGYLMAYYNPDTMQGIQNDLVYSFGGPGMRIMIVYNH